MDPKIVDVTEVKAMSRVSPATRIIDSLPDNYFTMRQTAEMVDVHIETLRRLCRTSRVAAPSKATRRGQLVIYLFTEEDVQEVKDYFEGNKPKHTATEAKRVKSADNE